MRKNVSVKRKGSRNIKGAHVVFFRILKITNGNNKDNCHKEDAIQAVLLYKRTQDARIHPGYWALIGGTCERKSPSSTVKKEIDEEIEIIGVNPRNIRMEKICDILITRKKGKFLIRYYQALLEVDMNKLKLKWNKKEKKVDGVGIGWFTAEEISHMLIRPEDRLAINEFFRKNGV